MSYQRDEGNSCYMFKQEDPTEVMRITKAGISVNPDLTVDEAAQAVLSALDERIKRMVKSYCVVLTEGEDNDYGINRVFLSDHPIDKAEWSVEMQAFNKRVHKAHEDAYSKRGLRYGYEFNTDAHAEYIAFMGANHPLKAFVEKHRLTPIEHVEIWTWGME